MIQITVSSEMFQQPLEFNRCDPIVTRKFLYDGSNTEVITPAGQEDDFLMKFAHLMDQ
jgi:hypothetical protein